MSERVTDVLGRLLYSALAGISAMMILTPLCANVAHAQVTEVPIGEVGFDVGGMAALAVVLALATEFLRGFMPAWRRGSNADPAALAAIDHIRSVMGDTRTPETDKAVEILRKLAVATGGMPSWAKNALRVVPVVLGVLAALAGWAPAVGDGSNPQVIGGVGAGLVASLFGGSLVGAVRSRLPAPRRASS